MWFFIPVSTKDALYPEGKVFHFNKDHTEELLMCFWGDFHRWIVDLPNHILLVFCYCVKCKIAQNIYQKRMSQFGHTFKFPGVKIFGLCLLWVKVKLTFVYAQFKSGHYCWVMVRSRCYATSNVQILHLFTNLNVRV